MKFIDEAIIFVQAGHGGSGCVSFRREKFIPRGGPDGGNGGKGGDIVLKASRNHATLLDLKYRQHHTAKRGGQGEGSNRTGKDAPDITIIVPVGTLVKDADTDETLADMTEDGQTFILARSGIGGKGNAWFATATNQAPRYAQEGMPGEERRVKLELKLLADVGIIGFPNVGKSTFIARVSAARPKIADYPFTTLTPNLGVVKYGNLESFVIADIPGLIEGAHLGLGRGIKFLRHIERTKVLLHIIDISAESYDGAWQNFTVINRELAQFSPGLAEKDVAEIARRFFRKLAELEPPSSDSFLFDTTNYFTFMASDTESELCQRGNNKEGRHWLRQVGVALLVSRDNQLPFFYQEYEGNRHDSKLFNSLVDNVMKSMKSFTGKSGRLTIVFDKGMNSEDNIAAIDAYEDINFITCYSPYFAPELIHVKTSKFTIVDAAKNQELQRAGKVQDLLSAWRTTGEYWGKERTVVVTYNPRTARKQRYDFEKRLLRLEETLYSMRDKVRKEHYQWKDPKKVEARYRKCCEELHLPKDLYDPKLEVGKGRLAMRFRKNYYRIGRYCDKFGKNIIVTDNMDWETEQIVQASLDRYMVEKLFRNSKDDDLVGMMPVRHWTDSKIRCHILTCIITLSYLRLVEIMLKRAGYPMSAATAMENMHRLHSCLLWGAGKGKPTRMIEEPTEIQTRILKTFGHAVTMGGVLQKTGY